MDRRISGQLTHGGADINIRMLSAGLASIPLRTLPRMPKICPSGTPGPVPQDWASGATPGVNPATIQDTAGRTAFSGFSNNAPPDAADFRVCLKPQTGCRSISADEFEDGKCNACLLPHLQHRRPPPQMSPTAILQEKIVRQQEPCPRSLDNLPISSASSSR